MPLAPNISASLSVDTVAGPGDVPRTNAAASSDLALFKCGLKRMPRPAARSRIRATFRASRVRSSRRLGVGIVSMDRLGVLMGGILAVALFYDQAICHPTGNKVYFPA